MLLLGLPSCRMAPAAQLVGVQPNTLVLGEATSVTLTGRHWFNAVQVDLDTQRAGVLSRDWTVHVGQLRLQPQDVHLVDSQTLTALVPGLLELGAHDVSVITPGGIAATLSGAITVVEHEPESGSDAGVSSTGSAGAVESATANSTSASPTTASSNSATRDTATHAAPGDAGQDTTTSLPWGTDAALGSAGETTNASPHDPGARDARATEEAVSTSDAANLDGLRTALVHRYSFEHEGTTVLDSVGGADGTFIGASLDGRGFAVFTGGGEYINLPNALLSGRDAVTIEVWFIWDAPNSGEIYSWQRIFDFGSNTAIEGQQGSQDTHLFLSPRSGSATGALHLAYRGNGTGAVTLNGDAPVTPGAIEHVVAVVDGEGGRMELYMGGTSVASRPLGFALSLIDDHNNWIGRSQLLDDPSFQGRIFEFRIYDGALSAQSLSASHVAGPDVGL